MSIEEAINYLNNSMAIGEDDDSRYHNEVLEFTIKALEQEHILDKIKDEIVEEKEYAYADFERYNEDLGQDWEDDFRYGMERCIEIIDKYKAESEVKQVDDNEFETLTMMIEHLESVEDIAYKKYEHYFENKNYDKAHIFMALSNRINLEIQTLEIYMEDK